MKTLYEIYELLRQEHPTHANVNTGPCGLCDAIGQFWETLTALDRSLQGLQLKVKEGIQIRSVIA